MGGGTPQRAKRPKYAAVAEKLKKVVADYENRTTEAFLNGIVSNISFV